MFPGVEPSPEERGTVKLISSAFRLKDERTRFSCRSPGRGDVKGGCVLVPFRQKKDEARELMEDGEEEMKG